MASFHTNHTVMPEALEKWPINTFRELLPRLYMFIGEAGRCYNEQLLVDSNGNTETSRPNSCVVG